MDRVFVNCPETAFRSQVSSQTLKIVLNTYLLITHRYNVLVQGK